MTRPNLGNILLNSGEREELERLFAYTDGFSEKRKQDPGATRRLLERIGYFEMMKDQQEEEEVTAMTPNGC